MKTLPLVILLSLLLWACEDACVRKALDEADSHLFKSPDTTAMKLDSLDLSGATAAQRALHALLLTKARDKAGFAITDTSLIALASNHYRGSGDSLEVQSLYYHGLSLKEFNNYSEALVILMEAADRAKDRKDNFYYAMACREQAEIYKWFYEFEQAAKLGQEAVKAFNQSGHQFHAFCEQIDLAQAMVYAEGHKRDAYDLILKLERDTFLQANPQFQPYFYNIASNICYKNDDPENALRYFYKISNYRLVPQSKLYSMISRIYLSNGDRVKAWDMLNKARETSKTHTDSLSFATSLIKLYADRGDYKEAYTLQSETQKSLNFETNHLIAHPYTALVSQYYSAESERKSLLLENASTRITIWVSVSILMLMIIGIVIFYHKRSLNIKEVENDILLDSVSKLKSEVDMLMLKKSAQSPENSFLMSQLNLICEARNAMLSSDDGLQRFGKNISQLIFNLTSEKSLSEIEALINETNDNLMERFMAQVPGVTEKEKNVAIFIFFGFSNSSIAAIMQYKSAVNVRQLRHKIKNKIISNPSADTELFLSYIELSRNNTSAGA